MTSKSNSATNGIRLTFDVALIKIKAEVESEPLEATVKQLAGMEFQMPSIPVGACIVIESNGKCVLIGITTETSGPGKVSQFSAQFMPLDTPCVYSKRKPEYIGNLPLLSLKYVVEVSTDDSSCLGSASKLRQAEADDLRAQIGPFVPSEMLEVFWSEDEIAAIEANIAAQDRYIEKANALFQTF